MNAPSSLAAMRGPAESNMPAVSPGFGSLQSFELMQRQAKLLCSSTLVPAAYRSVIEKLDKYGNVKERIENPNALSNCVIALNMAARMNADPLMVMQNLYLVEGRPSWSSQWIIAQINNCGRFSPLRFDIKDLGEKTVEYTTYRWDDQSRQKVPQVQKVKIHDKQCVACVFEKGSEERLYSPPVSIAMAVSEGWYTKNGSKWQTMDEVMLRYRAAAFFGKLYAPELLMGLPSSEEAADTIDMEMQADGRYAMAQPEPVTLDAVRDPKTNVDTNTGEIIDAQPATSPDPDDDALRQVEQSGQQQDSNGPGFEDAIAAVKSGDFDLARDIARGLSDGQKQAVEQAITNAQPNQQQSRQRRERGQGGLGIE